jgi:hypothetical protein
VNADQRVHVVRAAVLDLAQHAQPERGALAVAVLPGPQAQDVPLTVRGDPDGQVDRPVGDLALADLDLDLVDEHGRVDRVQRPAMPFGELLIHPTGDRGDRLLRHLRP